MTKIRCAIYTRKSSEEGLEQDFNSLDAQYEACVAYVTSQASEGWSLLPERYDDGGLSGGSMDRPALQRLLVDIASGTIDIVVVYKVDRLTRSLFDFAKLVESFDKSDVSFVSITQSFNTTTSMGRLTLNMLLSFAQFEREVTAERIRDKIAASKAKGMWMGGPLPLGYRPNGRSLTIVEDHAAIIRDIYERYISIGNVRLLVKALADEGISVPKRTSSTGRAYGGGAFTRGQIYKILNNSIYVGRIPHRDQSYPGLHEPIIASDLWKAAQAKLSDSTQRTRIRSSARHKSPLAGKLFDRDGNPLIATHATKNNIRYSYYVSRNLHHGGNAAKHPGQRIPANEIEGLVARELDAILANPLALIGELGGELNASDASAIVAKASKLNSRLRSEQEQDRSSLLEEMIERIDIGREAITVRFDHQAICRNLDIATPAEEPDVKTVERKIDVKLKRSGIALRLVEQTGRPANRRIDVALIRAIVRGRDWWQQLKDNPNMSVPTLADNEGVTISYITRLVRLAFLSPAAIQHIIDGKTPAHLSLVDLQKADGIPSAWKDQASFFGIYP